MLGSLSSTTIAVLAAPSVSSNSKTADSRTSNYQKFQFNDSFDRGSKKRTAMMGGEPTTNQMENLNKSKTPNSNINRCFFRRLGGGREGGLLPMSKEEASLDMS